MAILRQRHKAALRSNRDIIKGAKVMPEFSGDSVQIGSEEFESARTSFVIILDPEMVRVMRRMPELDQKALIRQESCVSTI
jgi:hypothetical protein